MGKFFFLANDNFCEPLHLLIPKIPFSFCCRISGLGHLRGPRISLGRIFGGLSIEPFVLGGGGASQRAVSTPPPPS